MTQDFLDSVTKAIRTKFKSNDEELVSICDMKLGQIYKKLETLPTELDRLKYAVSCCVRAILDHKRSERRRKDRELESVHGKGSSLISTYDPYLASEGYYETA